MCIRDRIQEYLITIIFSSELSVTCPGCNRTIHRSEACNEITCDYCGWRQCYHCGYASFQSFAILDHFSSNPQHITYGACPRYEQNVGSLAGEPYQCSSACQSHTHGDCNIAEHALWRKRHTFLRKKTRIKYFLQSLADDQRFFACVYLIHIGFDVDAPLSSIV